jgi:hypothetical protein
MHGSVEAFLPIRDVQLQSYHLILMTECILPVFAIAAACHDRLGSWAKAEFAVSTAARAAKNAFITGPFPNELSRR